MSLSSDLKLIRSMVCDLLVVEARIRDGYPGYRDFAARFAGLRKKFSDLSVELDANSSFGFGYPDVQEERTHSSSDEEELLFWSGFIPTGDACEITMEQFLNEAFVKE